MKLISLLIIIILLVSVSVVAVPPPPPASPSQGADTIQQDLDQQIDLERVIEENTIVTNEVEEEPIQKSKEKNNSVFISILLIILGFIVGFIITLSAISLIKTKKGENPHSNPRAKINRMPPKLQGFLHQCQQEKLSSERVQALLEEAGLTNYQVRKSLEAYEELKVFGK